MFILKNYLKYDQCDKIFKILKDNVPWNEGVKTRFGNVSRQQCNIEDCSNEIDNFLTDLTSTILNKELSNINSRPFIGNIIGIYLNYYRDGSDYCPKHRHHDTKQMIISLGESRTMIIDGISYLIENGDILFFENEEHSINKSKSINNGRISIAVFYI